MFIYNALKFLNENFGVTKNIKMIFFHIIERITDKKKKLLSYEKLRKTKIYRVI